MFTLHDSDLSLLKGRSSGFPPGAFARIGCTQYRVWAKARYYLLSSYFRYNLLLLFSSFLKWKLMSLI